MTDDSTLLIDDLLNKLVTLGMNTGLLEHIREHYSAQIKVEQPFVMKVVRDDEYITSLEIVGRCVRINGHVYLVNTPSVNLFFISISHQHQPLELVLKR